MGGHGGLNILPQKRWNVYNYENREKVRRDEEAAAREEQLKRDQSRRRDAEFRLERLRQARGIHRSSSSSASASAYSADSGHINLFDGLAEYSSLAGAAQEDGNGKTRDGKRFWKENAEDVDAKGSKKRRREEECPPNSKGAGAQKVYAGVWIGRQGGEGALVSVETRVIAGGS